ncbi:MAG TPA: zinc-dependent alcohol dehydrogenase family protein [Woeseiaceae bacterium]|nr:zinc-dependent alcohol dehydrogenase family protein [Woeseiaceae bacterium]
MHRAWVINDYDGFEGLSLEEFPDQEPGPGEVRLRVEAFALNWGDMDLMENRYSYSFSSFPAGIGMEAAGIVDAVGPGVDDIEVGERYATLPHFYDNRGASGESLVVKARYLTKAPAVLSAVESASIWMQYLTAYYPVVELAKAQPGRVILVTAATSTAGTAALRIGRLFGATMIGTTRYEYNRPYLLEAGADHVVVTDSSNEGFDEELKRLTDGRGIDAAFDAIGGGLMTHYVRALAKNARIFFYGMLDKDFPEIPYAALFQSNALFQAYSLFNYVEDDEMCAKGIDWVNNALAEGHIAPNIDRVYPMEDYVEACRYLKEPRRAHGKVVIETGIT